MFSVIIPVHNKLPHLDRSIMSVLNQTFRSFELILIDDASEDGSSQKIRSYNDPRIRLYERNTPGPGGYAARNLGIKEAKYDWVVFLDADDVWENHHLENIKQAIGEFQTIDIISTKWVTSKNGLRTQVSELKKFEKKYTKFSIIDFFYTKSLMWTGAIAIKTRLLRDCGGFPEGKCKRGGDMDTWIRCLAASRGNVFIGTISSVYFKDTVNQVTNNTRNPAMTICAAKTIESLRSTTNDDKLKHAIDAYCASFAFTLSIASLKRGGGLATETLGLVRSRLQRSRVLLKIYIYKLMIFLKLR